MEGSNPKPLEVNSFGCLDSLCDEGWGERRSGDNRSHTKGRGGVQETIAPIQSGISEGPDATCTAPGLQQKRLRLDHDCKQRRGSTACEEPCYSTAAGTRAFRRRVKIMQAATVNRILGHPNTANKSQRCRAPLTLLLLPKALSQAWPLQAPSF
ncbi:unnamed protein product [Caretta caretta]